MNEVRQELLVKELHVFDLFEVVFVFLEQLVYRLLLSRRALGLVNPSLGDVLGVYVACVRLFVLVESDDVVAHYSSKFV